MRRYVRVKFEEVVRWDFLINSRMELKKSRDFIF